MRDWSIGVNSHPDWRTGSVDVIEQPWWLALIEWFALWVDWTWLYEVPFPSWPAIERDGERTTPREWYGNLGCLVNLKVTNPLYQWVWIHPKRKRTTVEIGYDRCRELFYAEMPEYFDREAAIADGALLGDDDSTPTASAPSPR